MKQALLLSGGMDSSAIAYWKRPDITITIDYGQSPAPGEMRAALEVSSALSIPNHTVSVDLRALGSGDLVNKQAHEIAPENEWWPYRNQMLITLASMVAINEDVTEIMIGALRTDGFHKDGSLEFVEAIDNLTGMQEGGIRIVAPAIELSADELVRASEIPFDLLAWTHSCHKAEYACGTCRGCIKHYHTMEALGYAPY